jgi:crotonobetainyl-CoA:carnitine CoA-transferase CaiB-like acyl-CoA transferase
MGKPEVAEDARLKEHMGRVENAEEVKRIVEDWLDARSGDEEIYWVLEDHRTIHATTVSRTMQCKVPIYPPNAKLCGGWAIVFSVS